MVREGNTLQLVEQVRLTTTVPHSGGEHLAGTRGRKKKREGGAMKIIIMLGRQLGGQGGSCCMARSAKIHVHASPSLKNGDQEAITIIIIAT